MACLAFGRGSQHLCSGGGAGGSGPVAGPAGVLLEAIERGHELSLPEDPGKVAQEAAVFEAMAQHVTAFICSLDEATVNVGAAEPPLPRPSSAIHLSSSSGGGGGGSGAAGEGSRLSRTNSSSSSSKGGGAAPVAAPALFRRLHAGSADGGFGWRDARAAFELACTRENRCERMVARSDPGAAAKRLQQRLLVARLEPLAFKGCSGPSSLFEALSLAAWGTAALGPALRGLAVSYARGHPHEYRGFLGDDWEAYLSGMARPGAAGDELMLRAVSDSLGVPINIVTSDPFCWFQRYAPVRTRTHRELTLAFLGPHCWMPVRKQSAMTAIRLTLTGSSELRAAREMRTRMQQLELRPGTPPSTP